MKFFFLGSIPPRLSRHLPRPLANILSSQWHDDNEKLLAPLPHVYFRPTFVVSNFVNQISAIKERGLFYQSFGNGSVSFLDPRDLGEAVAKVAGSLDVSPYLGNGITQRYQY